MDPTILVNDQGLHQRHNVSKSIDRVVYENVGNSQTLMKQIRRFDIYPKVKNYVKQQTYIGAIISIVMLFFVLLLGTNEFLIYMTPIRQDRLGVDMKPQGQIDIFINVTFPRVHCLDLHVDIIDVSGEQQIDVRHRIHKTPVNDQQQLVTTSARLVQTLGSPQQQQQQQHLQSYFAINDRFSPFYCGSCYAARVPEGTCCNTCESVMQLYAKQNLNRPREEDIEQCLDEVSMKHPGCNFYGVMTVSKVNGNFHFAPGRSFSQEYETSVNHIHEFNPFLIQRFNSSHIIHQLNFGVRIPFVTYPLDQTEHYDIDQMALHKYFIKVVPTQVKSSSFSSSPLPSMSSIVDSYQFSYSTFVQKIELQKQFALPGVFFVYDLSPITVTYEEASMGFLHFVVKMCAIVGGIYTIAAMLVRLSHLVLQRFIKKEE